MFARTSTGDWKLPLAIVTDPATVAAQEAQDSLNLWQGEWFADTSAGTPWLSVLGTKRATQTQIKQMIRTVLLGITNIASVKSIGVTLDTMRRHASYSWAAFLASGVEISGGTP